VIYEITTNCEDREPDRPGRTDGFEKDGLGDADEPIFDD
jgi:hypothetical protein